MLWTLIVILALLWALGFGFSVGGSLIHLLLVLALAYSLFWVCELGEACGYGVTLVEAWESLNRRLSDGARHDPLARAGRHLAEHLSGAE